MLIGVLPFFVNRRRATADTAADDTCVNRSRFRAGYCRQEPLCKSYLQNDWENGKNYELSYEVPLYSSRRGDNMQNGR